jgi:hypothetical protein
MGVSSSLTLQVAYYNSEQALWEPLIEPVEQVKDGKLIHWPWELRADVSFVNMADIKIKASFSVKLCSPVIEVAPYIVI